jgi:hypothetical protein
VHPRADRRTFFQSCSWYRWKVPPLAYPLEGALECVSHRPQFA